MEHMGYDAVRTDRYKFIRYREFPEMDELYDLEGDPYEMENLAHDPNYEPIWEKLEAELGRLKNPAAANVAPATIKP
jgi:arylsulfatase A-like enzyme